MTDSGYRLVTRSDFDGLVSAMLLKELGLISDIKFVHPKDMQDGIILIAENDITTNLPYTKNAHLAFDHHLSETLRLESIPENYIIDADAPSTARVIYNHYGGASRFSAVSSEIMAAVDKSDTADFTLDDILNPGGWVLISFLMDARTGLGRFREFRVSNYQFMMGLIDCCRDHTAEEILALPDSAERVSIYQAHQEPFVEQLKRCTTIRGGLGILDLRSEETIYAGNRFMIYALFPEITVSLHVIWGLNRLNTVVAAGKSILNRASSINLGEIMLGYGGGGHRNAGTCQIENDDAERVLGELIPRLSGGELSGSG
ncbi:MAG: exopolyphosphatase [Rhodospirillales bacterium]|nr:exopolyphosphatase [Rhodospirillales bacterium]